MTINRNQRDAIALFRRRLATELGDTLEKVVLFGSKAREDDRPESDIDLLVVCNTEDWRVSNTVYSIATDVLLDTDISLSPKVLSRREYYQVKESSAPFWTNVLREGIAV